MNWLEPLMNDPVLMMGFLLFVLLCFGAGLYLLAPSGDAKHMEEAECLYHRSKQLDEYRAYANFKSQTRKGSPHAHRTKS